MPSGYRPRQRDDVRRLSGNFELGRGCVVNADYVGINRTKVGIITTGLVGVRGVWEIDRAGHIAIIDWRHRQALTGYSCRLRGRRKAGIGRKLVRQCFARDEAACGSWWHL